MSREKQIEEMAKTICKLGNPCQDCYLYQNDCRIVKYAKCLYNAGSTYKDIKNKIKCSDFYTLIVCGKFLIITEFLLKGNCCEH